MSKGADLYVSAQTAASRPEDGFLVVEEAAEVLGITLDGLRMRIKRARRAGAPTPFVLLGTRARGRLYVDREDLLAWDAEFQRSGPRKERSQ